MQERWYVKHCPLSMLVASSTTPGRTYGQWSVTSPHCSSADASDAQAPGDECSAWTTFWDALGHKVVKLGIMEDANNR